MSSRLYQSKSWFWEYVCTTRPDSIISFSRPLFFADWQCFCHVAFAVKNREAFVPAYQIKIYNPPSCDSFFQIKLTEL